MKRVNILSIDGDTYVKAKDINYKKIICIIVVFFSAALIFFINLVHLFNNIVFFIQNTLKCFLFYISYKSDKIIDNVDMSYDEHMLPMYTVLIPIYLEAGNIFSMIEHMEKMHYPKTKLDIKLIIEDDDAETIEALSKIKLHDYYHIVRVPKSFPRTKPKAMNYAMDYVSGEYLVVYDIEDRPELDQIMKAVMLFKRSPDEMACIQAKLNFYNKDESLLTKFFSIEYSIWFDRLLQGLDYGSLPIPLAGTSNHLRVSILRKLGMWDAYNVTEDADLGFRIYLSGYYSVIMDSYTYEESLVAIVPWIKQRSRWIKGHIQTFLVYLMNIRRTQANHYKIHLTILIFLGFSTYSFFIAPWMIFASILSVEPDFIHWLSCINIIFTILYMYITAFISFKDDNELSISKNFGVMILWPLYFILHTFAAHRALYELATAPFVWNKTEHGVSSDFKKCHLEK